MYKIIMELNEMTYISKNEWNSLEEFFEACPLENEFPDYDGDGDEGVSCNYSLS